MVKRKKQEETITFGPHVMLDAYRCDPKSLNDKKLVYKFLDTLPAKIGMKKMMKPYVMYAEANDKKDPGGWSGFVMIQESHISIHTFIKRRFVTADIYSCKEFDTEKAVNFFKKAFKPKNIDSIVETRGKKYPAENIDK
jgi:S-adenosylmethionine decarboxylase